MNSNPLFHRPLSRRVISATLAFSLAVTHVFFAHRPLLAALPPSLRSPHLPVVILQDIHGHPEAQAGLHGLLQDVRKSSPDFRFTIGVEGAAGPFNFTPYQAFPDRDIARRAARQLMAEGAVPGPVIFGFENDNVRLLGIEDPALYADNVNAYRTASRAADQAKKALGLFRGDVDRLKAERLAGRAAEADDIVERYRAGRLSLAEYLRGLTRFTRADGFMIQIFLAAHELETGLDFARAQSERDALIARMGRKLSSSDLRALQDWVRSQHPKATPSHRLNGLFDIARSRGVAVDDLKVLADFRRYLALTDSIDPLRLFQETSALEREALEAVVPVANGAARGALDAARWAHLAGKLIRFELTPDEWADFRSLSRRFPFDASLARGHGGLGGEMKPFERFYELAEKRDDALFSNALSGDARVLVAGGFHSPGLTRRLKRAGRPFVVLRPAIGRLDGEASAYLNDFSSRKTPLQRLFSRSKLFLSPPIGFGTRPLVPTEKALAVPGRFAEAALDLVETEKPELSSAARAAARALVDDPYGESTGLFSAPEVREAVYALPLALAWLLQGPALLPLLVIGVFVQTLWFAADHEDDDAFARRVWIASTFVGVFFAAYAALSLAGVPHVAAVLGAFVFRTAWHRLNNIAADHPDSIVSAVYRMTLPFAPVRMTIVKLDRSSIEAYRQMIRDDPEDFRRQIREATARHFISWRISAVQNHNLRMGDEALINSARDDRRFAYSMAQSEIQFLAETRAAALREVNPTPEEIRIRIEHDLRGAFKEAAESQNVSGVVLNFVTWGIFAESELTTEQRVALGDGFWTALRQAPNHRILGAIPNVQSIFLKVAPASLRSELENWRSSGNDAGWRAAVRLVRDICEFSGTRPQDRDFLEALLGAVYREMTAAELQVRTDVDLQDALRDAFQRQDETVRNADPLQRVLLQIAAEGAGNDRTRAILEGMRAPFKGQVPATDKTNRYLQAMLVWDAQAAETAADADLWDLAVPAAESFVGSVAPSYVGRKYLVRMLDILERGYERMGDTETAVLVSAEALLAIRHRNLSRGVFTILDHLEFLQDTIKVANRLHSLGFNESSLGYYRWIRHRLDQLKRLSDMDEPEAGVVLPEDARQILRLIELQLPALTVISAAEVADSPDREALLSQAREAARVVEADRTANDMIRRIVTEAFLAAYQRFGRGSNVEDREESVRLHDALGPNPTALRSFRFWQMTYRRNLGLALLSLPDGAERSRALLEETDAIFAELMADRQPQGTALVIPESEVDVDLAIFKAMQNLWRFELDRAPAALTAGIAELGDLLKLLETVTPKTGLAASRIRMFRREISILIALMKSRAGDAPGAVESLRQGFFLVDGSRGHLMADIRQAEALATALRRHHFDYSGLLRLTGTGSQSRASGPAAELAKEQITPAAAARLWEFLDFLFPENRDDRFNALKSKLPGALKEQIRGELRARKGSATEEKEPEFPAYARVQTQAESAAAAHKGEFDPSLLTFVTLLALTGQWEAHRKLVNAVRKYADAYHEILDDSLVAAPDLQGESVEAINQAVRQINGIQQSSRPLSVGRRLLMLVADLTSVDNKVVGSGVALLDIIKALGSIQAPSLSILVLRARAVVTELRGDRDAFERSEAALKEAAETRAEGIHAGQERMIFDAARHYRDYIAVDPRLNLRERQRRIDALFDRSESDQVPMELLRFTRAVNRNMFSTSPADIASIFDELLAIMAQMGDESPVLPSDIPLQLASLAVSPGAPDGAADRALAALVPLNQIVYPPALEQRRIARALLLSAKSGRSAGFLEWFERQTFEHLPAHEIAGWRLVALQRADPSGRSAADALKRLLAGSSDPTSEHGKVMRIARFLMRYRVARSAFLDAAGALFNSGNHGDIRRMACLVGLRLGDASFATLMEQQRREHLARTQAQAEDLAILLRQVNESAPSAEKEEIAGVQRSLESIETLLSEMRIPQAQAAFAALTPGEWSQGTRVAIERRRQALETRLSRLGEAWALYQKGDYEQALELVARFNGDSTAIALKNRLLEVRAASTLLEQRRPQPAEARLAALPTVEDPQLHQLRARIRADLADAERLMNRAKRFAQEGVEAFNRTLQNRGRKRPADGPGRGRRDREQVEPTAAAMAHSSWTQALALARQALEKDKDYEGVTGMLVNSAEQLIMQGQSALRAERPEDAMGLFEAAQAYLFLALTGNKSTDLLRSLHEKAETLRRQARVLEFLRDVRLHRRMLAAMIEADEFAAERTGRSERDSYAARTFVYDEASGMLTIPALTKSGLLFSLQTGNLEELRFETYDQFLLEFEGVAPDMNRVRLSLTFINISRNDDGGFRFEVDESDRGKIRDLLSRPVLNGVLRPGGNQQIVAQAAALDEVEKLLSQASVEGSDIADGGEGRGKLHDILNRLFGLDISDHDFTTPVKRGLFNEALSRDQRQMRAIEAGIDERSTAVVWWGPPGSGKTTTADEVIEQVTADGVPVVAVSQSNAAVDNIVLKLMAANKRRAEKRMEPLTIIRIGNPETIHPEVLASAPAGQSYEDWVEATLRKALRAHHQSGGQKPFVILVTNNSGHRLTRVVERYFKGRPLPFLNNGQARAKIEPVLIQEEASRPTLAEFLVPLFRYAPRRLIKIGDHRQLPPHGTSDEDIERVVREVERHEFVPSSRLAVPQIFSPEVRENERWSLFARVLEYQERLLATYGHYLGVSYTLLAFCRRSHWLITMLFSGLFYDGRLLHRDQSQNEDERAQEADRYNWERVAADTVMVIDRDRGGRRFDEDRLLPDEIPADETDGERNDRDAQPQQGRAKKAGASLRNFGEAGEVIRAITYYLNTESPRAERRVPEGTALTHEDRLYKPEHILILSPYKAQNRLIRELLTVVSTLNDFSTGAAVSTDEMTDALAILRAHAASLRRRSGSVGISADKERRILSAADAILSSAAGSAAIDRRALVEALFDEMNSIYNLTGLSGRGMRHIGRADVASFVLDPMTVDSIQGQEREVVILSLVRSNSQNQIGFLGNDNGLQRLNVALSRAQEKLAIIGSMETLRLARQESREPKANVFQQMLNRLAALFSEHNRFLEQAARTARERAMAVATTDPEESERLMSLADNLEMSVVEWNVLSSAPRPPSTASLLQAWGISTGRKWLDAWLDVTIVPAAETIVFLSMLGWGLWTGSLMLIVAGLIIKVQTFPALHHLFAEESRRRDFAADRRLAARLAVLYLASWLILALFGLPASSIFWWAMLAPLAEHIRHNAAVLRAEKRLAVAARHVNGIDGVSSPAVRIDQARPRVGPARIRIDAVKRARRTA